MTIGHDAKRFCRSATVSSANVTAGFTVITLLAVDTTVEVTVPILIVSPTATVLPTEVVRETIVDGKLNI